MLLTAATETTTRAFGNMIVLPGRPYLHGMPVTRLELESALSVMLDTMPRLRFDPAFPEPILRGLQLRGPDVIRVLWD